MTEHPTPLPADHPAPSARPADAAAPGRRRNKTLATWLALLGGSLGLHRFYLHGWRDAPGWLYPLPTLAGWVGVLRMRNLGQDDRVAWVLIPLLGLMLTLGMLAAIVNGLTSDEQWARRHRSAPQHSGWLNIIGVVIALMVGGAVLMGALAFGGQKFFEVQLERDRAEAPAGPAASAGATDAGQNSQKPHQ